MRIGRPFSFLNQFYEENKHALKFCQEQYIFFASVILLVKFATSFEHFDKVHAAYAI